jgi:hypothetical protein
LQEIQEAFIVIFSGVGYSNKSYKAIFHHVYAIFPYVLNVSCHTHSRHLIAPPVSAASSGRTITAE